MSEDIWNKCDTRFFVYHSWVPPMCSQVMLWSQHVWRIAMRCNLLPRRSGEGCDMYFMLPKGHFWEARHAENCFSSLSKIMTWVMGQLDPSRGSKLRCPPYHCWWTSSDGRWTHHVSLFQSSRSGADRYHDGQLFIMFSWQKATAF